MTYGELLKKMRKDMGMSQKKFAEYCYTPLKTIQNWEQEERRVPQNFMRLLAYKMAMDNPSGRDYSKELKDADPNKKK